MVLHGSPPFQVSYTKRKDKEPAREFSKTFTGSRAEFTDQPEDSGHYTFTFTHLSDANYKRIELAGPSINQVVHPPASADFAHNVAGTRGRKKISSCSGSAVDVDVDLKA